MIDRGELADLLAELGVDALLITAPANVRYLSGFTTPEDGRVLITADRAWLISDARYDVQANEESRLPVELRRDWLPWAAARAGDGRLGVEADSLTLADYQDLSAGFAGTVVPLRGALRSRRMIKSDRELASLRRAAEITDAAFQRILDMVAPGIAEVDLALELERTMRREGAEAKSFEFVVASGTRSAMPHGVATNKLVESGELLTFDLGARVAGYHADMTRTVAVGALGSSQRALYQAVLEAQLAAIEAVRPGVACREVDAIARGVLAGHGLEERFVHGLGHGVGLQIHEEPKLSKSSDDVLAPGMTVTVEPGVYLPGEGGVRIEDLVLVTESGCELLSRSPKELRVL